MDSILHSRDPLLIFNNMDSYFKNTPPDCILFTEDYCAISVHKELLYHTKFMREMIMSVGIGSKIEIICPSLSKKELETIAYFLYNGKILCSNQSQIFKASKNLEDLFGFPLIQDEIYDTEETIILPCAKKKPRKQSLNLDSMKDDFTDTSIKVERDPDNQEKLNTLEYDDEFVPHIKIEEEDDQTYYPFDYEEKQYNCEICNHSCKTKDGIRSHIQRTHEGKIDKCSLCDKEFKGGTQLKKHIILVHEKGGSLVDKVIDPYEDEKRPFRCEICNHKCGTKMGLYSHIRKIHEGKTEPVVNCPVCGKDFKGKRSLELHIQTVHEKKKPFSCDICGSRFGQRSSLRKHKKNKLYNTEDMCKKDPSKPDTFKEEKERGDKSCPVCKEVFESFSLKVKHVAAMHPERKIFNCSFCDKKFLKLTSLKRHLGKQHEKEHGPGVYSSIPAPKGSQRRCPICNGIFKSSSEKMKHYISMHPEAPIYDCSQCKERYTSLCGLNIHIFTTHERKVSELGCAYCGKEFTHKDKLKEHIIAAHKDKKYECSECDVSYRNPSALQSHIEKVHEGKKHQCTTCGEMFQSLIRLETHVAKKHDRNKLYECPSCNSTYMSKETLEKHIAFVHEKSSGHLCPECGENFQTKRQMKDHIIVVHEGKGFECPFCNKILNSSVSRNGHIRSIHGGKKPEPMKCSQCDKIYSSINSLTIHMRAVHEKKRPFACHICDLSFGQSGNLKTHLKGKHKEFSFAGRLKNGSFLPE